MRAAGSKVLALRDGSDEYRAVVVLKESGTAGIELRAFRHAGQRGYVAAGGLKGSRRLVARFT